MKIAVFTFCLLLAGCGGKSTVTRVRIANQGSGIQTTGLPIILAQTLGYYRAEGLEVELDNLPSAGKTLQALLGNSVDVAVLAYAQNIQIAAEGQRMRSFFISSQRSSMVMLVSPVADKRISRAEDMKGKLLGVASIGSQSHLWARHYLAAHGVKDSEFSTVGVGLGATGIAALENGRVDAAVMSGGDHFHLLKRHPDLRILVDGSTAEGLRDSTGGEMYAAGALAAKQDWLNRNGETARRLAKAAVRAMQWLLAHSPEEIRQILPEGMRSADPELDRQIIQWGLAAYTKDGRMPKGAPENLRRFLEDTLENVRTAKFDLGTTWTDEYLPGGK